jgi:hypothetical protein
VLANSQSSLCFPFCGNCHEIDSSISSSFSLSLSLSLSLSASLTGSSCGANNIRSRRPEYWLISSFSISSPVTCSADSRYHHDVTYEARNQQKVSVCQCFRRSRRGNNPWSLQSHTEPRRRSESSAGTMFATQTAMLTLAYFLNSDMGHKTIPRASYRLPTSLPNTLMLPASHSPPVISQMRTIRWQSDLFTDHSVFPLLSVLTFFPFLYIKPTKPKPSDTAAFVPDLSSEDLATLQSRRLALRTRPPRKPSARTRRSHPASLVREPTALSLATSATRTLPRPKTTSLPSQDRNPGYSSQSLVRVSLGLPQLRHRSLPSTTLQSQDRQRQLKWPGHRGLLRAIRRSQALECHGHRATNSNRCHKGGSRDSPLP